MSNDTAGVEKSLLPLAPPGVTWPFIIGMTWACGACDVRLESDSHYCPGCGRLVDWRNVVRALCDACGTLSTLFTRYCRGCGRKENHAP